MKSVRAGSQPLKTQHLFQEDLSYLTWHLCCFRSDWSVKVIFPNGFFLLTRLAWKPFRTFIDHNITCMHICRFYSFPQPPTYRELFVHHTNQSLPSLVLIEDLTAWWQRASVVVRTHHGTELPPRREQSCCLCIPGTRSDPERVLTKCLRMYW